MKNVLMIGAPGNISTSTIQQLLDRGDRVSALTLPGTNCSDFAQKVTFFFGNRRDGTFVQEVLDRIRPEVVIDYSCFEEEDCRQLCELLRGKIEQYLFLSTVDVYGYPLSELPMPEHGAWNPPNCSYAEKKLACEQVLRSYSLGELPYTIVRPAYSMGNRFMLSALSRDGGRYLVARIEQGLSVFSPGDGTTLIHVGNAYNTGRMIAQMVGDYRTLGESFTCAHDSVMTYDRYLKLLGNVLKKEVQIRHIPSDFVYQMQDDRTADILLNDLTRHNVFFDTSKFQRFYPQFRWEKRIEESITDFVTTQRAAGQIPSDTENFFEAEILRAYSSKH